MPKAYEKLRDSFIEDGMTRDDAQERAARIYNSMRRSNPKLPKLSSKHKGGK